LQRITDLAHEESTDIGRELKRVQKVRTVKQVEGSTSAGPIQESDILPIATTTIARDHDDEGAGSEVAEIEKATGSGTQYFVTTTFFSETQGQMLLVQHRQARRPEHKFRWHHPFASTNEKLEACAREKQNWINIQAMECISKSSFPKGGNLLTSSVIYKWKNQETLKAIILPDGRGNSQRYFLRTDSPTMSPNAFIMMMSKAAEGEWSLGSLDIKAAYLQAEDVNREIDVTPLEKKLKMILFGN
jgi:hypothetical protein